MHADVSDPERKSGTLECGPRDSEDSPGDFQFASRCSPLEPVLEAGGAHAAGTRIRQELNGEAASAIRAAGPVDCGHSGGSSVNAEVPTPTYGNRDRLQVQLPRLAVPWPGCLL